MNVYVSPELRELMRHYDKRVNWSDVATNAFKEEMARQDWLDYVNTHGRALRRKELLSSMERE
jgi:hypothetical protein